MYLQVSIALLLILLTGGFSLDCHDCETQQQVARYCSTKTCSAECRSTKTVEYFGPYREQADNWQRERNRIPNRIKNQHATCPGKGFTEETIYFGCGMPHECKSWSLGTGCWTIEYVAECCNTNRCNQQAPVVSSHIRNGKRCFTCDEDDCSKTINCWGNEDHCFTAYDVDSSSVFTSSHQSVATKGCASKSACDQEPGKISGFNGNITCCEGNLCNSVTQSSMYYGAHSVTQSSMYGAPSVTNQSSIYYGAPSDTDQSFMYYGARSVAQISMYYGAHSVTQSFLFLCGSLLYFLLH